MNSLHISVGIAGQSAVEAWARILLTDESIIINVEHGKTKGI
jgi:hypothetical protein